MRLMPKHSLRIVPFAGNPPARFIILRCEHCAKFLEIERYTLVAMLVAGIPYDKFDTPTFIIWSYCPGRPLTYPWKDDG